MLKTINMFREEDLLDPVMFTEKQKLIIENLLKTYINPVKIGKL